MSVLEYCRLTLVIVFGAIPALFLTLLASIYLFIALLNVLQDVPLEDGNFILACFLGVVGTIAICDSALGATKLWHRIGLLAGIAAALALAFLDFSSSSVSLNHEPIYWVLSPVVVAVFLLLESFVSGTQERTDISDHE